MKSIYKIVFILLITTFEVCHSNWEPSNNGIRTHTGDTSSIYIEQIERLGELVVARSSDMKYLYFSTDEGAKWQDFPKPDVPDTALITTIFSNKDTLYAVYATKRDSLYKYPGDTTITIKVSIMNQSLYRTFDDGKSWEKLLWNRISSDTIVKKIFACGQNIFLAGYGFVYYSSDGGNKWELRHNGLPEEKDIKDLKGNCNFLCLAVNYGGIYCSSNLGEQWFNIVQSKTYGFPFKQLFIANNNIYAGMLYYGLLVSTDKGDSWDQKQIGNAFVATTGAISSFDDVLLYGATTAKPTITDAFGVYASSDAGKTWSKIMEGLPLPRLGYAVYSFAYSNEYVFMSFSEYGIFRMAKSKLKELASSVPEEEVHHFYAAEPAPTPANTTATIRFYWDTPDFDPTTADIAIYDVLGNRVGNRNDVAVTPLSKSSATIVWNSSYVATGVYFLVVNYRGEARAIRIVVVK